MVRNAAANHPRRRNIEMSLEVGSHEGRSVFSFGGFRLDAAARQLKGRDGKPVKLSSRAFDLLVQLVSHRGETLTKRHLLREVWPDVVVSENNLNQAIVAIRRVLGDDTEPRRFVQTVSGRGFCFVAWVQSADTRATVVQEPITEGIVTVADYFNVPPPA
jgi:DNA-binding winged helix-turn-helix (wHTH) protein